MIKDVSPALLILTISSIIVGLVLMGFGIKNRINAYQSKFWPTVQGIVAHSSVGSERDDDEFIRYRVSVSYDYVLGSKSYYGRVIQFSMSDFRDEVKAKAVADKYPKGDHVTVYYEPENPDKSVLEPGGSGGWLLIALGLFFSFPGFCGLWMAIKT
ncbi:MAG: DUF3592 domain-containing protein [Gammaproteobacteria bacterium]|nr:DUF3592 domain-containing protein [Gammaproteobacteria bacterium]